LGCRWPAAETRRGFEEYARERILDSEVGSSDLLGGFFAL
jgi:hypothetical protein